MPDSGLDKLFITGVSPVTMDDVTSGFNIGSNVSLDTDMNEFMGFTESETNDILQYYHGAGQLKLSKDFYITQSETEMNKGYSDIYMEPFLSKYPDLEYSYLIGLKYLTRSEYCEDKLQEKIKDAQKQLDQYAASDRVKCSIGSTQLIRIILVYKGWELDYCEVY